MSAPRSRRRGLRIGLALAGGGSEGAVYELGALRALEENIEGLELNSCDVYVGVSAGALIAAALANGRSPAELVRGLISDAPGEPPFDPASFFVPAYREWARRGLQLPRLLAEALRQLARPPYDQSLLESLARISRALPLGLFDSEPLRRYLAESFSRPGRTDDFRRLRRRLFVVAADLEAGTPIVFGSRGWQHVPISRAVQASTAVPGIYPPVEVDGRLCVDGVLLRTLHASVALEHGADLLFCINPLVPVDVATGERLGKLRPDTLRRSGMPGLLSQTFRTMVHSRMVVGMSRYKTHFPDADVVLFEPARDEYRLFFSNMFSFKSRRRVCEIAYQDTRRDLWRRRRTLAPILRRYGLRLRTDLLRQSGRSVWRGVPPGSRNGQGALGARLSHALDELTAAAG